MVRISILCKKDSTSSNPLSFHLSFTDASNFNKHMKIHTKNSTKAQNMDSESQPNQEQAPPIDIQIIIPQNLEGTTEKKVETSEVHVNQSDLQLQELTDGEGNTISFTTADGQPIPIVSSGNEKIQGLMPDGTLVSFDLLPEGQNKQQENDNEQETTSRDNMSNLINTEIQYLDENSSSNSSEEKQAFLSEDGKVCFITSFDENSFLTMS